MRQFLTLFGAGAALLAVQSGLATVLPPPWCPDLGLLAVIAIGLIREGVVTGFVLAVLLGYAADLGSGSLLGQHALLRLMLFSAARLASTQLNLAGSLALMAFTAVATLAYGIALIASSAFFGTTSGAWPSLGPFVAHGLVNALAAPLVAQLVVGLAAWSAGDEATGGRRSLRLQTGGPAA